MSRISLRILESPEELTEIETLQRVVWPGNETDVVPSHMLLTAAHNGGLVVGAYYREESGGPAELAAEILTPPSAGSPAPEAFLVGFVFGFPGLYHTPDGPRPKHCSHMLGVHPGYRDQGIGFLLKRAQWQMVRHQGLDRVTWTFDPLQSRNAHLNILRLGATCNTYLIEAYGEMRDGLNVGIPSDRFQVDWWVNSTRVIRRLSKHARQPLDLAHFLAAEAPILNPTRTGPNSLPRPVASTGVSELPDGTSPEAPALVLIEIPADIQALKAADPELALEWRLHTRELFVTLFQRGYLITDFVHLPGSTPRSFYILTNGEASLDG